MEDSQKKEAVNSRWLLGLLAMGLALYGCGASEDVEETGDSSPTTSDSSSGDTADSSEPVDVGSLIVSYEFSGFPDGARRCGDTGFSSLFLDLILEGEPYGTVLWPCDDSSIVADELPFGSWKMTLSTTDDPDNAEGAYGLSTTFMTFLSSDEVMEPHLILECHGC
jgi:hypothetical protein